jgi:hypothetical protein
MTSTEQQLGNKEPGRLKRIINWKFQTRAMREYKAFCEMDEQTLEMYTAYRLPTPPKDEPFKEEYPDPATNPLLREMRESAEAARTGTIIAHVWYPLLALLASFIIYLLDGWVWLYIALWGAVVVDQIITAMLLWGDRIAFAKSYAYVESLACLDPDSDITQTYWNFKRWEKWALARYDFESEAELFTALKGKAFTVVRTGPMEGLLVSNTTGEEWPLKPVQV